MKIEKLYVNTASFGEMYGSVFQASNDGIYYLAEENSKIVYINNRILKENFSFCRETAAAKIMFSEEIGTTEDFENCVHNIMDGVFCSDLFYQNRFKEREQQK